MKTTTLEREEEQRLRKEEAAETLRAPGVRDLEHEELALKAYECWMERGCPEGSPEED